MVSVMHTCSPWKAQLEKRVGFMHLDTMMFLKINVRYVCELHERPGPDFLHQGPKVSIGLEAPLVSVWEFSPFILTAQRKLP